MSIIIVRAAPLSWRKIIILLKRIFRLEDAMSADVDHFIIVHAWWIVDTKSTAQLIGAHQRVQSAQKLYNKRNSSQKMTSFYIKADYLWRLMEHSGRGQTDGRKEKQDTLHYCSLQWNTTDVKHESSNVFYTRLLIYTGKQVYRIVMSSSTAVAITRLFLKNILSLCTCNICCIAQRFNIFVKSDWHFLKWNRQDILF